MAVRGYVSEMWKEDFVKKTVASDKLERYYMSDVLVQTPSEEQDGEQPYRRCGRWSGWRARNTDSHPLASDARRGQLGLFRRAYCHHFFAAWILEDEFIEVEEKSKAIR